MERLNQDIKTGQYNRLYLLCGDDDYFRNFYKNRLKKALVTEENMMNFSEFTGKGVSENEIMDTARTIPFLSDRRVVFVVDSNLFKGSGKKSKSDDAEDDSEQEEEAPAKAKGKKNKDYSLSDFLSEIPETTVLVFCESNVDKRTELYKAVAKNGYVANFDRIKEDDRGYEKVRWYIGQKLKKENKNITNSGLRIFQERTGTDMQVILTELEKLINYAMDREVITEEDVRALVPERVEDKVYKIIDCLTNYQQKKALDIYYDLLLSKVQPVVILMSIEKHYHQIYVVKSLSEIGMNWKEILQKGEFKTQQEFIYKKYASIASKYSYQDLKKAMEMCLDYDKQFRSGKMKDNVAVEMVIVAMTSRKKTV